jgi:hypothetical protein
MNFLQSDKILEETYRCYTPGPKWLSENPDMRVCSRGNAVKCPETTTGLKQAKVEPGKSDKCKLVFWRGRENHTDCMLDIFEYVLCRLVPLQAFQGGRPVSSDAGVQVSRHSGGNSLGVTDM